MLYDPKWEKQPETKADPLSLASLIAWLEKQPAEQRYDYTCIGHCLLAIYFTASGFNDVEISPTFFKSRERGRTVLPEHFNEIALGKAAIYQDLPIDFTFGDALARARHAARR